MADRLAGKVALITGGGSGIGAATARRFVEEGAQVVVADLNVDSAEAIASELGGKTIGVAIDVVDRASIRTAIERTVAEFGGLDVLVCNAGVTIVGSVMASFAVEQFSVDRFRTLTMAEITARYREFQELVRFEPLPADLLG